MTTPNLGLSSTSEVAGSAIKFVEWRLKQDGNSGSSNMGIIDSFAGTVSASVVNINGSLVSLNSSITNIDGSLVTINNSISAINGSIVEISGSLAALSGSSVLSTATYATPAQVTAGSSGTAVISASALAYSDYGKRTGIIPLNATDGVLAGTEYNYIPIPSTMNGWKLVDATASCSGSSTSGSPTFLVYRSSASSLTKINMLSVNLMIDQGEYDSSTSGCAMSIDTSVNTVYTGDKVWAYSSGSTTCGTNVAGVDVSVIFQKQA